jgi:hypothetical protein
MCRLPPAIHHAILRIEDARRPSQLARSLGFL